MRLPFGLTARDKPLSWAVVVASPKGEAGQQWGDTWFAADVVAALERADQKAKVIHRGGAETPARDGDDVVLVLRGLRRVRPRPRAAKGLGTTWLMWVISHPELVEEGEIEEYDACLAASLTWKGGQQVTPLLQATNPERFRPSAAAPDSGEPILFVGSTRGNFRPIVRDGLAVCADIGIYGVGWEEFLGPDKIRAEFLPNAELPAAYAGAGIVLNDHWPEMAEAGFLSNRLFDAAAAGARIISDCALGLEQVFGPSVRTYRDQPELRALLDADRDATFGDRTARLQAAAEVARLHSFDARVQVLIEKVREIRGA